MPITINPAPHGANEFHAYTPVANARELLSQSCPKEIKKIKNDHIIQTSFQDVTSETNIYPSQNGFVDTVVKAYNEHQHLEIRPEDVWFSILSQLNIYINENAEALRDMFVSHQGQKYLEISGEDSDIQGKSTMFGVDWGKFTFKMTKMIEDNIKDPSLREWILPSFTTTTKVDQAVAAILMMATFQKYFSYGCSICCGLPSVTLLGQKSDWEKLAAKVERLPTLGEEPKMWYGLLKPVLARFVSSFDAPEATETKDFWQKIAHYSGGGSGPTYLSVCTLIVLQRQFHSNVSRAGSRHFVSGVAMERHFIALGLTLALIQNLPKCGPHQSCSSPMHATTLSRPRMFLQAGLPFLSSLMITDTSSGP